MPVLNEISVGTVLYQVCDGVPTHSATYGVVALDNVNGRVFNYNGSGWEVLMRPHYGRIFYSESAVITDTNNTNWFNDAVQSPGAYTRDPNMRGLTSSITGNLRVDEVDAIGKYLILITTTFQQNGQLYVVEIAPALNNIIPTNYIKGSILRDTSAIHRTNISASRLVELLPSDVVSLAKRYASSGSGPDPGYIVRNNSIQVIKVDEPIIEYILDERWGVGTFSTNTWTVANDAANQWFVGTSTAYKGLYSAYISNDAGVSNAYSITPTARVSHFYRDITIPNVTGDFYLSFDWKCTGQDGAAANQFDFGTVHIVDTTTTPAAGTALTTTQATIVSGGPTGSGRIGAVQNLAGTNTLGKFNLTYGGNDGFWRNETILMNNYKGLTRRLVFGWQNDTTTGTQPPFAVDNIKLYKKRYI